MATERSTKAQVQAYRFGVRRVETALATGVANPRPGSGPRPGVSLVIGLVLAALVVAGFAVYGFIRPAPAIDDARVLVDSDSGGAFVVRDGVAHPALNLASAMLAAVDEEGGASAAGVRQVNGSTLATVPKGQLLGIPGAPHQVPKEADLLPSVWQVCDVAKPDPAAPPSMPTLPTTTAIVGLPASTAPVDPDLAVLVTTDGTTHHLLWQGRRARIADANQRAVAEALGLDLDASRRVSLGLLNTVPEAPPIAAPSVPGAGSTVTVGGVSREVGEVLRVERATTGEAFYVVLGDGVQEISPVVADLIRSSTGQSGDLPTVPPAEVAQAPRTRQPLQVASYPPARPKVIDQRTYPGLCVEWRVVDGEPQHRVRVVRTLPLPAGAKPVPAPPRTATTTESTTDQVYVPPQHGVVLGQSADGRTADTGALFLVTDQGIANPVVSPEALAGLGLGQRVEPVSSELVALLPLGPTLDPVPARRYFGEQAGATPSG